MSNVSPDGNKKATEFSVATLYIDGYVIKIYATSVSLLVVLVTVTLSVRLALLVSLLLFPRISAINNKINTAIPTTHTHGEEYQVVSAESV